jgi:bifunctional enzyme CysN/CysC
MPMFEADPHVKINPLASWSTVDIAAYATTHRIPPHPLAEQGYWSIGCAPGVRPGMPGRRFLLIWRRSKRMRRPKGPLRFPVQWVNRSDGDFRGFAGTVVSGRIAVGDRVVVAPSGKQTSVARIVTFDGDLPSASAGRAVSLTLPDEVDITRGDVLTDPRHRSIVTRRFAADLVWMDETPAIQGKCFPQGWRGHRSRDADAHCRLSRYRITAKNANRRSSLNAIGRVEMEADPPVAFDPYAENRETGSFILIDRATLRTGAAGMVVESLNAARNVHCGWYCRVFF